MKMGRAKAANFEDTILEVSKRIIETEGISGLTARNVARQAGCAVGTIYNVFRNMDELILKINASTLLKMQGELSQNLEKIQKNQSLGREIAKSYIGFANRNGAFWNLLFEFNYPNELPKWYQDIVDSNFSLIENAISNLLSNNSKLVKQASRIIWASFHGIVSLYLSGKLGLASNEGPESLCESLFGNYMKGLTK
jgi:AcrR family transcriptional regulator